MVDNSVEINLREFFGLLLKRFWMIALCALVVGGSAFLYARKNVLPKYEASTTIYINNNSGRDANYVSSGDLAVALRLVASYVNIIQSERVMDKVIEETGLPLVPAQLRSLISAEPMGETEMLKVTVSTANPQISADIANAVAKVAPGEITEIIEGSSAKIVDYAKVPQGPSTPSNTTYAALGAAAGAVLAVVVILLQMVMDVRIKNEEELIKICPIPVLGSIPYISTGFHAADKKTGR